MLFERVRVYTSDSEATPDGMYQQNFSETHVKRLTLAMPIGEAASDIAGAILKLKYSMRQ